LPQHRNSLKRESIMTRRSPVRLRAALAGGLVLGVTASFTLASWNDAEYASGAFTASVFRTESSVQGAGYASNTTSPGATVTLAGAGFTPSTSAYFPVLIRTTTNSIAGRATLYGATLGGADASTLGVALVYRVVRTTSTCDATAFTGTPTYVVGAASTFRALTAGQESGVSTSLAAATGIAPGAPTGFCFEVTLPTGAAGSLQGKTSTATWQFIATSS
jgi:predicted ribosomally synthesized peptide with SipW-like signal peptide